MTLSFGGADVIGLARKLSNARAERKLANCLDAPNCTAFGIPKAFLQNDMRGRPQPYPS
jgi:hypothetical protein